MVSRADIGLIMEGLSHMLILSDPELAIKLKIRGVELQKPGEWSQHGGLGTAGFIEGA